MQLFTVGHSNHSLDAFLRLLEQHGITAVVDVRTNPHSRFNPQFNKASLEAALQARQVAYTFAGKYLGGRPSDPTCYKARVLPPEGADYLHAVDYPEVMKRDWFIKGIARLLEIAGEQVTAVMCSEENPAQCHRHHLIAKYLQEKHPEVEVRHIRGDGQVISAASIRVSVDDVPAEQLPLL